MREPKDTSRRPLPKSAAVLPTGSSITAEATEISLGTDRNRNDAPCKPIVAINADDLFRVTREPDLLVPMRDGTTLRADVYRPVTDERVPVIVMRTPYGKETAEQAPENYWRPERFAEHGYLVVVQDVRGQFRSPGEFYPFKYEADDGYDTVEWAAALPGSNGRVGMYGYSYPGAVQWLAAAKAPPHLMTIVPGQTSSDYYQGWTYQDGTFAHAFISYWLLEWLAKTHAEQRGNWSLSAEMKDSVNNLSDKWFNYRPLNKFPPLHPDNPNVAQYFFDYLKHSTYNDYWKQWAPKERYESINIPVFHFASWYDMFLTGGLENFVGMRKRGGRKLARDNQKIVIGPWTHDNWTRYQPTVRSPTMDFGAASENPLNELHLKWFDRWLKQKPDTKESNMAPAVQLFVMGENRWLGADDWPIPGTIFTEFFLGSDGHANTAAGDGRLHRTSNHSAKAVSDTFRYDPDNPVPSVGGHNVPDMGPAFQKPIEDRSDVLFYTSAALKEPLLVAGPIQVKLFASSSAIDTDFTAKLVDVHPNGDAMVLNTGIIRAAFRESLSKPSPISPGSIYEFTIQIWPTANMFKKDHRVRLEISSSSFPGHYPNPNTGLPIGVSAEVKVAQQTVWHGSSRPSRLILPVIPPSGRMWLNELG